MQSDAFRLAYQDTSFFSSIVRDYISGSDSLRPFYAHEVTLEGVQAAIEARKGTVNHRAALAEVLRQQYAGCGLTPKQQQYLELLASDNTFTICTAHQPNIFTGHLYFIYKILHAIKLADTLAQQLPGNNFIPVYYMGSEDADLDELGHIYIKGEKYSWPTNQSGAVGRMIVDAALLKLLDQVSGQITVLPHGAQIIQLMRQCYQLGQTIEQATFQLVNALFAEFGLLIVLPDNAALKRLFVPVMQRELMEGFSYKAVQATMTEFPSQYKVQASGREINLFYLADGLRERIELSEVNGERRWTVVNTSMQFDEASLLAALETNPECFSPNVILRPVFQETILPNIAFVGGGGEIAYWLELKKVFESTAVPYPMLVVRNSFLLIDAQSLQLMEKLQLNIPALFQSQETLLNKLVQRDSAVQLQLDSEKVQLVSIYQQMKSAAAAIDPTLAQHTEALQHKALEKITALEKKMLRAEKRKFAAQQQQLSKVKQQLFPNNSLQERVENFMLFFAQQGPSLLHVLYNESLSLEQQFTVLVEKQ